MQAVARQVLVAMQERGQFGANGGLVHAIGGLLVLLVPLVLNIYKPRGLTRRGQRQKRPQQANL